MQFSKQTTEKFGWFFAADRSLLTFTSGTSEQFWEVETDLKWEALTRAAEEGEEGGVFEADLKGQLALRRVHQGRVGQAHLDSVSVE